MARTLIQIQREMEKLQAEAERVKASEVAGVIAKIKSAIAFYGITPGDLFGAKPAKAAKGKRKFTVRKKATTANTASLPKYKDPETGKTWTGHGKRPGWFVRAVEGGRKAEELVV